MAERSGNPDEIAETEQILRDLEEALHYAQLKESAEAVLRDKERRKLEKDLAVERENLLRRRYLTTLYFVFGALAALTAGVIAGVISNRQSTTSFGNLDKYFAVAAFIAAVLGSAIRLYFLNRQEFIDTKLTETAQQRARDEPEKPQLLWDLGRLKLEKYLDRNLNQVAAVGILTCIVMLFGFGVIVYGLFEAFQDEKKLPVAIVSTASGVLVSFIGGTFLLIYKSLLNQAKENMLILERINSVGMSMSVIDSIRDDSSELRQKTTAELAKRLLNLYGGSRATRTVRR